MSLSKTTPTLLPVGLFKLSYILHDTELIRGRDDMDGLTASAQDDMRVQYMRLVKPYMSEPEIYRITINPLEILDREGYVRYNLPVIVTARHGRDVKLWGEIHSEDMADFATTAPCEPEPQDKAPSFIHQSGTLFWMRTQ